LRHIPARVSNSQARRKLAYPAHTDHRCRRHPRHWFRPTNLTELFAVMCYRKYDHPPLVDRIAFENIQRVHRSNPDVIGLMGSARKWWLQQSVVQRAHRSATRTREPIPDSYKRPERPRVLIRRMPKEGDGFRCSVSPSPFMGLPETLSNATVSALGRYCPRLGRPGLD
jgi:hypothetical protein